jgi:hypothetical protein
MGTRKHTRFLALPASRPAQQEMTTASHLRAPFCTLIDSRKPSSTVAAKSTIACPSPRTSKPSRLEGRPLLLIFMAALCAWERPNAGCTSLRDACGWLQPSLGPSRALVMSRRRQCAL